LIGQNSLTLDSQSVFLKYCYHYYHFLVWVELSKMCARCGFSTPASQVTPHGFALLRFFLLPFPLSASRDVRHSRTELELPYTFGLI